MSKPKVVFSGATGIVVWAVPDTTLEIMWAGPGGRLLIGQITKVGGAYSHIDHHTANAAYDTRKEAEKAVAAFLAAGA